MGRRPRTPAERLVRALGNGRMYYLFRRIEPGTLVFIPNRYLPIGRAIIQEAVEKMEGGAELDDADLVQEVGRTLHTLVAAARTPGPHAPYDHHLANRLASALRSCKAAVPDEIERLLREAEALPALNVAPMPRCGAVVEAVNPRTGTRERFRVSSVFFGLALEGRGVMARPLTRPEDGDIFIAQTSIIQVLDEGRMR
jgi:hypothetical protein